MSDIKRLNESMGLFDWMMLPIAGNWPYCRASSDYDQIKAIVKIGKILEAEPVVISEHYSKSIALPVCQFSLIEFGLSFVMRENFYGWDVSVLSEIPLPAFDDYDMAGEWRCFFEGFPDELKFGAHKENPCRFSLHIPTHNQLIFFVCDVLEHIQERLTGV